MATSTSSVRHTVRPQVTLQASEIVAPPDGGLYDVFLSLRGETRTEFTNNLYNVLKLSHLRAYIDKRELLPGGEISDDLIKAIKNSKTYVVVFSKDYATSPWCLNELVQIYKCYQERKNLVIGVYYHIIPAHVRQQKGSFEKSFKIHETGDFKNDIDLVKEWRGALEGVANLSGLKISAKSDDADNIDFINEIARVIKKHVKPKTLHVADHFVARGILQLIKNTITKSLSSTERVKGVIKIGLHGFGGVGKTTLAKALYNHLLESNFDASCFLADVREVYSRADGLLSLQNKLITGLLDTKTTNEVHNDAQGTEFIKTRLGLMKVLLVIDDVDKFEQCKSLMGPYAPGSVVIITTRDTTTLDNLKVEPTHRFEVNVMNDAESLKLFTAHAFPNAEPDKTLMDLFGDDILRLAGKLPLALQVFGSYLATETNDGWEDYIKKLGMDPNSTIMERLMISLDAMDDLMLKNIFIDIACFFNGMKLNDVVNILDTCYPVNVDLNIRKLRQRSLLTIVDNCLRMHDLLQHMGRKVARNGFPRDEPEKHTRLWRLEDIRIVLLKQKGTDSIKGIIPSNFHYHDVLKGKTLPTTIFQRMGKLRILHLKDVELTGSFEDTFEDLTWLRWDCCLLTELPSDFWPEKLIVLELRNSNIKKWELNKVFENLKTLDMSNSLYLTTTPDFTSFPNLETLNLEGCTSLEEVNLPEDRLTKLVSLKLSGCLNLKCIRVISSSSLGRLKDLDVSGCERLETLPHQLWEITSLMNIYFGTPRTTLKGPFTYLNISRDFEINALPSYYSQFLKLEQLYLVECRNLLSIEELPPNLKKLVLCECTSLERLPNLSSLTQLEHLDIENCIRLTEIQGLEKLSSLEELGLYGCNSSLHANILTRDFFQIWSQLGSRIIISVGELPSWFPYNHRRETDCSYTIPSDMGQILSMIICLEHNNNDEVWDYECDVKNVTTGEIYTDDARTTVWASLWGLTDMIILPTSIISLKEGDKVEVTSDGLIRGIHLVYGA